MSRKSKIKTTTLLSNGFILNTILTIAELVAAYFSGSVALISDGLRNLTDSITLTVALIADKMSGRRPDSQKTWGYGRIKVIASLINILIILAVAVSIAYNAIEQLRHPKLVDAKLVIFLGIASLLVNGFIAWTLRTKKEDINIRATYTGLLFGSLSGGAVLLSGICTILFHWRWIDSVTGLIIAVILTYAIIKVLIDALNVLLEAVPPYFDLHEVRSTLLEIEQVHGVSHPHAWVISQDNHAFTCNLEIDTADAHKINEVLDEAKKRLRNKHNFSHCVIEVKLLADNKERT
jgi:cobalt-zinc-cadmium efflux system protein